MDKAKLKALMTEMAALGTKYGVSITPNGGTISATDAKIKFIVKDVQVGAGGKTEVVVTAKAKQMAGFENIDITKTFTVQGKTHRVIDYHPRKYKAPWITEATDGKTYKWSTQSLKLQLALSAAPKTTKKDGLAHLAG